MNILIVDDQASQRTMYRHLLEAIGPEVHVTDFGDPVQALLWSQKEGADLLLLDYRMPKMDGLEFARRFRRPLSQRDVPIILVTVVGDEPVRDAALEAGVTDFMVKPVRPRELRQRCTNLLELRRHQVSLKSRASALEHRVMDSMREINLREPDLLRVLSNSYAARRNSNTGRAERLFKYAGLMAESMSLLDQEIKTIELATSAIDIGMNAVPDTILNKSATLSDAEMDVVRGHVQVGRDVLASCSSQLMQLSASASLYHHERWDGSGYPEGRKGEDIPLEARIAGIADVFDALLTARPHRAAMDLESALDWISKGSGTLFDPKLVQAFVSRRPQIEEILQLCPIRED